MKRSKKVIKVTEDDEDEELWDFKSLKRTKKSNVKTRSDQGECNDAKSAFPKIKLRRSVAKVATERMRSQIDTSDTEDSDCLIVGTNVDTDFKENRKRVFLASSGINDDLICKSTSSKQTQLLVDNDELSQKLQTVKSPQPPSSGSKKTKTKQSSKEKMKKGTSSQEKVKKGTKKDPTANKNKDIPKAKRKARKEVKSLSKNSEKSSGSDKGTCPFCQVPFSVLLRLTPDAHTMECMDLPFLPDADECPDGLSCNSQLPSHYRKYKHTVLAESRSTQRDIWGENDADLTPSNEADPNEGLISATLPEDRSVDLTLKLGLVKDDACIKISCTPKSTGITTSSSVSPKQTSASKSASTVSSPADDETDNIENDEENGDGKKTGNKHRKRSRKNIANDFIPSKSSKTKGNNQNEMDVEIEGVEGGGFCVLDDNDINDDIVDKDIEKDLAELLGESEDEEDKGDIDNEDEIDDTGIEIDDHYGSSRSNVGSNKDEMDDCGDDIDNTCDTGFDDVRSEINEDGDEIDIDFNDDLSDTRNEYDKEICNKKSDVTDSEQETVNLCDSNSEVSQDEKTVSFQARKQTSIFNFFNCPPKKSIKKSATQTKPTDNTCDINDLKNGLSRISSAPAIKGSKSTSSLPLKRVSSDVTYDRFADTESDYGSRKGFKRMCPFYKKIPDTAMTVDAFCYGVIPGCRAYILTHFHYDHYGGLNKNFKQSMYCSKVTGNLVASKIKVDRRYINTLPMEEPCVVEGVELTLMEANHCPGAVIIVFRLKSGQTYLHTGDFRADPAMEQYPALVGTKIHQLYLDTTYCDPAYSFPSQTEVIKFAVSLSQKHMEACPTSLIVCGSYTIGKERVFIAIAEALSSKICVRRDKKQILDCLEDDRLADMVTLNPGEASVHVLPMGKLNPKNLGDYLSQNSQFTSILALAPTGWSHSNRIVSLDQIKPKYSRNGITIYGIPYSEHSSYLEMKRFTQFIRADRILPTVNNGNPQSRKKMEDIFRKWMSEIKDQDSKNKETLPTNKQASLKSWFG